MAAILTLHLILIIASVFSAHNKSVSYVKVSVKKENFVAARWTLGHILHPLQDFYSHSNWVEMGNTAPYSTLIRPDQPFENLAGFGPLIRTTNADIFKDSINKRSASGGGDIPELSLSGLQVNFLLTDSTSSRRRRRGIQVLSPRSLTQSDAQLYHDLAQASGGQAIEVTKSDLSVATTVIEDSSASDVVTDVNRPGCQTVELAAVDNVGNVGGKQEHPMLTRHRQEGTL
ncbi:von Willebrand factor A domain-containing protein 7-like [Scomber scombrus]|uniref:von Willebrand factor A domain-containing protein 7-like n=1 Tax=Scomber scombrus TaxID=13677 RepID=A0AAV1PBB9_SCOSC